MTKLLAAVVQAASVAGDTPATVSKAVQLIAECGRRGASIVVFPEAFIGGYPKGASFNIFIGARTSEGREEYASYFASAIPVPGVETATIARAAKLAKAFVAMGVIERDGGTLYCTVLFFSPDGELLGKHRKTMPTAAERLCWGFGDASTLTVVETPWGKLGSVICWENYMPLLRTAMYGKGVTFYCAPTADDRDSWAASMRHVSLEGRCFVLSACQYMTRDDFPPSMRNMISSEPGHVLMRGGSMIVSPLGQVLAGPDYSGETILAAELDVADVVRGKFDFDVVGHYARPDLFSLTVNERSMSAVRTTTEEA
jgi:nitrilase